MPETKILERSYHTADARGDALMTLRDYVHSAEYITDGKPAHIMVHMSAQNDYIPYKREEREAA